jgi:gliding motility-associated-like protein
LEDCIIPEGISPNGDGYNDYFEIPCIGETPASLQIWNRWGSEVYRSENYGNDWEGIYKGEKLPDGTYYYVLRYTNVLGTVIDKGGFVVIHR